MNTRSSLPFARTHAETVPTQPTHVADDRNRLEMTEMNNPSATSAARYLTNDEAATFLKLSPRTLEKQRVRGDGPAFRKFGRRVVYAIADLEAWANERVCSSTSEVNYLRHR